MRDILILSIQRIDYNKKIKNNIEIQFCDSLNIDKFFDLDFKMIIVLIIIICMV